jgi:plastocyanin
MTTPRRLFASVVVLTLISVGAVAFGSGVHEVVQADRKFQESGITIARGDIVRFTNDDPFIHQIYVNARDFDFESQMQPPKQVVEVRFTNPGVYQVMCHIHPTMHLTVTVN